MRAAADIKAVEAAVGIGEPAERIIAVASGHPHYFGKLVTLSFVTEAGYQASAKHQVARSLKLGLQVTAGYQALADLQAARSLKQ